MPVQRSDFASKYLSLTALALATALTFGSGANWVYAQDSGSQASADGSSSGSASGSDSSSASQSAGGGVDAGSNEASGDSAASADASQTSGDVTTSAAANTGATATAEMNGDSSSASAEATAAGSGTTPQGGAATPKLTATANAEYGETPTASASTSADLATTTSATSVYGVSADAFAPGGTEYEKVGKWKTVAVAVLPNGTYSVAVTTRKSSFAKSGAYDGDYETFSGKDMRAAVRAAVAAYAKANNRFAEAGASANGRGSSAGGGGWATTSSNSRANACVGECQRQMARRVLANCEWRPDVRKLYCRDEIRVQR